jgi:hypothetical protein
MKKPVFLGLLLIAILGVMIVPAYAFVNPNPTTPPYNPTVNSNYELYGPHVAGINCDIYTTEAVEWAAMNGLNTYGTGSSVLDLEDWALTTSWISTWTSTSPTNYPKAITLQTYGGENGYFLLDMNNNATLPDDTLNPMADLYIREAIAYLVNRTNIVSVIASGLGLPMYTYCPTYMSTYLETSITPKGGNSSLCYTSPGTSNSDPALAAAVLNGDPYLCSDGSKLGTVAGTWYDDYLTPGTWVKMPTMTFYVRSDDPEREEIGDMIEAAIKALPTPLPISEVYGSAGVIETPVMYDKDFAMYTEAWTGIGPTPDVFFDLYAQEAYLNPGFCPNYDHIAFDNTYGGTYPWATNELTEETYLYQDFSALTTAAGTQAAKNAQYQFALQCDAVPIYCHSGEKAVSNTPATQPSSGPWMDMVNLPSVGFNNWYTTLDAVDPTATTPSNLYMQYGFKSTLELQNILYYSWYWDSIVLGEVYDRGATLAPDLSTWVPQLFENWSIGTWTGVYGTCSYVNLTLRPDVYWQDGVPLTMADVIYTLTQCGNDLIADGLPPPWWWPTVSYFVGVEQIDAYNIQILLDIQSVWALAWVISSVIIPMHIWQPMISNYVPSDFGVQGKDPTMSFADPYEVGSGPYRFHTYSSVAPAYAVLDANLKGSTETGEYSGPALTSPGYWQYYPLRVDVSLGPYNLARVATSTPAWGEVSYYANINLYNLVTSGTLTVNKYVYIVNDTSMANAAADLATATPIITDIGLALAPGGGSPFSINTYDIVPSDTEYVPFTATQPNAVVIKVACQITGDMGIRTTAGPAYVGAWINVTQPMWFTNAADIGGSNLYADLGYSGGVYTFALTGEIPTPDLKVDGRDITLAAKAFGTVPGSSRWNPVCDVNHDYKIDGRDITIIAKQFGWPPPPPTTGNLQVVVYEQHTENALSGASVRMTSAPSGQALLSGITDTNGQYTFWDVEAGSYAVSVSVRGYQTAIASGSVGAGQAASVTAQVVPYVVCSVPVTITNTQPLPTASPFQQLIQVDSAYYSQYEAAGLQNVEFFYSNGAVIRSWLESGNSNTSTDTVYWLSLESIPANSSITIYMAFVSPGISLFNDETTGEAPELSPVYGQYDSGANVFPFYDNFAGNTLSSIWTPYVNGGVITVNNGLTIQGKPGTVNGYSAVTEIDTSVNGAEFIGPSIFDIYFSAGQRPDFRFGFRDTDLCSVQNGYSGNGIAANWGCGTSPGVIQITSTASTPSTGSTTYILTSSTNTNYNVFSIAATSSVAQYYLNYAPTSPGAVYTNIPSYSPSIGIGLEENYVSTSVNVSWVRTRSYPPNGVMPTVIIPDAPLGIVYSVPVVLNNTQSVATPAPFQQMIGVDSAAYSNYESLNLQNVEFFYADGTLIPSWLESGNSSSSTNSTYWLNIANGIPAQSSITLYMGFAPLTTNLFNNQTTGEAPQLSPAYGEYDDGANVFTSYWNFAGTTLPSDWSSLVGIGANLTVDNGVIYQSPGYASGRSGIETVGSYNPENQTVDMLVQSDYTSTDLGAYGCGFENSFASTASGDYAVWTGQWSYEALSPTTPLNTNWNVLSSWTSATEGFAALNYTAASFGSTSGFSASTSSKLTWGGTGADLQTTRLQWARVRADPPNGVMPTYGVSPMPSLPLLFW